MSDEEPCFWSSCRMREVEQVFADAALLNNDAIRVWQVQCCLTRHITVALVRALDLVSQQRNNLGATREIGKFDGIRSAAVINRDDGTTGILRNAETLGLYVTRDTHNRKLRNGRGHCGAVVSGRVA
jgi:hypothetical protein